MMRRCCYNGCKNEFEFNANQKYCSVCAKIRYKVIMNNSNSKRDRQVVNFCRVCAKQVPKWHKFYCSEKCKKGHADKKLRAKRLTDTIKRMEAKRKELELLVAV